MTTNASSKNPVIATVLNVIIPGLGYLYAGVRTTFAWLLLAAMVLSIVSMFDPQSLWYINKEMPYMTVWEVVSMLLVFAAFGYDAYTETKNR